MVPQSIGLQFVAETTTGIISACVVPSGTLRDKLKQLTTKERVKVAHEVQKAARQFFPNNQMNFPGSGDYRNREKKVLSSTNLEAQKKAFSCSFLCLTIAYVPSKHELNWQTLERR